MTKSRFFRGLGHFPAETPGYSPAGDTQGCRGGVWGLLTGVVSHVGVGGQAPDVVGLDDVRVPLLAVAGVVQHVVERLGGDVLAGDAGLWGDGWSGPPQVSLGSPSGPQDRAHPQGWGLEAAPVGWSGCNRSHPRAQAVHY